MGVVTITDRPMALDELLAIASGSGVELDEAARSTIAASRAVIDRVLAEDEPVYGLNTGVGHMKDTRLPLDQLRSIQTLLLMSHAGGTGPPLPALAVRAAMAARLNGIARGGSGASPSVAEVLLAMLNAGVHPVVPSRGSVGAADLGQLATIGQVALGGGRAELAGEILSGADALARAGIAPLLLEPKDGLTFMSSNAVSIGEGAIALDRARRLAPLADAVAALSLETTRSGPSVVEPAVGEAKPFAGQIESCAAVTAALAGGDLLQGGAAASVQAPLSLRVIPQVHGAMREAIDAAARAVAIELNGRGDNPLVSIEHDSMIHNGNFHPVVMAIAFDQLRVALAHVGQLSERRMGHLWDAFFAAGPPEPGSEIPELFGVTLRYPAAAAAAELKRAAAPATLDVPPLDIGVEDHATNAPLAVRTTAQALDLLEEILSIEVLLACDVIDTMHPSPVLGSGTGAIVTRARDALAALRADRSPATAQAAVATALRPATEPTPENTLRPATDTRPSATSS
jgi:histidine ammonia-lyase